MLIRHEVYGNLKNQLVNSSYEARTFYLLEQIRESRATAAELEELMQIMKANPDPEIIGYIKNYYESHNLPVPGISSSDEHWQNVLQNVMAADKPREEQTFKMEDYQSKTSLRYWWWAAAAAVITVGIAFYFSNQNNAPQQKLTVDPASRHDVPAPSANLATITLDNGQQIYLDSAGNGTLTAVGNVQIVKLADGQIVYKGGSDKIIYNTLSNPRGSRVIDMTLSDGSRVWLNAGSSVSYPVAFIGNERKVSVKGEAFFEVAHNAAKPFIVSKDDMQVKVLGTQFNINAYEDEPDIKVTLIQGSVSVQADRHIKEMVLKAGEQSQLNKVGELKMISNPDIEETMAWKNDKFIFTGNDIRSVMRQLEKWYDVEVEYQGNVTTEEFVGVVPRTANVSEILYKLESTHAVSFEVTDKKILVK